MKHAFLWSICWNWEIIFTGSAYGNHSCRNNRLKFLFSVFFLHKFKVQMWTQPYKRGSLVEKNNRKDGDSQFKLAVLSWLSPFTPFIQPNSFLWCRHSWNEPFYHQNLPGSVLYSTVAFHLPYFYWKTQ